MASQPPMRGERLGPFLSALPLMHTPRGKHQGLRDARREIGSTTFPDHHPFPPHAPGRPAQRGVGAADGAPTPLAAYRQPRPLGQPCA